MKMAKVVAIVLCETITKQLSDSKPEEHHML